jgi:predicted  nucleic acid-binding Zn-ribbon protein
VAELSDDVIRQLYSVPPEDFMQHRGALVDAARKDGDAAAAAQIAKLRKPTVAAWIVNALVHDKPATVQQLTDLGDRLRAAQDKFDATKLRALSDERRKLVDELTAAALKKADRGEPSAALRDEVSGTFEAAIADEEIAGRLGRLQRSEQWSGFGFLPTSAPQLSVVRGGRDAAGSKSTKASGPKVSAAERRRADKALATARDAFEKADAAFSDAVDAERGLQDEVRQLTRKLAKLQDQLDAARGELERARKDVSAARGKRREARTALDKAERNAPD